MKADYTKSNLIDLYNLYIMLVAIRSKEAEIVKAEIERREAHAREISLDQFIAENERKYTI